MLRLAIMHCGALQLLSSMMMRGRLPHCTILLLARPVVSSRWSRSLLLVSTPWFGGSIEQGIFFFFFFPTNLASHFGRCGGQSCIFLLKHKLFFSYEYGCLGFQSTVRTCFVELENCCKFGLKDMSLVFLIKTSGY